MAKVLYNEIKEDEQIVYTRPLENNAQFISGSNRMSGTNVTVQENSGFLRAPLTKLYVSGETLAANATVFLEDASADISKLDVNSDATSNLAVGATAPPPISTGTIEAQGFNESVGFRISKVKVFLRTAGTPTDSIRVGIQSNNVSGNPNGIFLGSATRAAADITGAYVEYAFTLDEEVDISPNVKYWLVLERTGTLDSTNYYEVRGGSNNPYASNGQSGWDSTNGWSTESAGTDLDFELLVTTVAGRVYNASALDTAQSNAFIGFNKNFVLGIRNAIIQLSGEIKGLSGLSQGLQYYLSNTRGAIASAAGTVTRKVGIATSTTTLLITDIW